MSDGNFTEKDLRDLTVSEAYKKTPDKVFAQVASEIKQMKDEGTISSGIGQVSEGLNTMSKIPILGNMFSKPAWISAQAANIFKHLGFSKPTVQGLPCESKLRGQVRMANYDGADTSHKLALSAQNEIETKSGLAGTSADEMDLSHVLSIPNFWDRFTWSTSDLTGSTLWDNDVTPMKIKPYSDVVTDKFRCTHMGFVANTHGYWRGSIVYTFKFVKTQYHSGRLRISFIPFYFNTDISTGTPDVSRTQKIIVDLRTSTEVSFTVPYVSSRPWMFCIRPESSWLGTNSAMMYNAVTGIVRVEVLNQLVAANSVYQSIDTIVEVSGGPDLTFAAPMAPSYIPYNGPFTATEGVQEKEQPESDSSRIVAQVMGENEAIHRNDAQHGIHPIAIDTHKIDSNWSPEAHCIGEKVMSVRQLIKRFGMFQNSIDATNVNPNILIAPFSVRFPPFFNEPSRPMSLFEYYYYIYGFWRGSMRIKALASTADTTLARPVRNSDTYFTIDHYNSVQDSFNALSRRYLINDYPVKSTTLMPLGTLGYGNSMTYISPLQEGLLEFEVPYYNVSHISPATIYAVGERPVEISNVLKGHIPPSITSIQARGGIPENRPINYQITRAAGDDYTFMYLVGVPPLINVERGP